MLNGELPVLVWCLVCVTWFVPFMYCTFNLCMKSNMTFLIMQLLCMRSVGSLTESTLKTVPQVVNVQELKDKSSTMPLSTVIGYASSSSVVDQSHHFKPLPAGLLTNGIALKC